MNDTTYAAYVLDKQRTAELLRQQEIMQVQRERGGSLTRPHGRRLAAWFHAPYHGVRTVEPAASH